MSTQYQVQFNDASKDYLSPDLLKNLVLKEIPIPEPGPQEVLVRVHAASLNYRDILVLANSPVYPVGTIEGVVPASDGAGEIVKTGPGSQWKDSVGEAVILAPGLSWLNGDYNGYDLTKVYGAGDHDGTLSQYKVVEDARVIKAPKNFSYEEAAALISTSGTAMNILSSTKMGEGTTVVTQGTGGVSCSVIQYASALGARVIATSSSNDKLQLAKKLGATDLINYRDIPDWGDEVLRMTNNIGADLVSDVAGWATIEQSLKAIRPGGTVTVTGFLSQPQNVEMLLPVLLGGKIVRGIMVYSRDMLEHAVRLAEQHSLKPWIEKAYDWKDAGMAFDRIRKQDFVGKIVVKVA